MPINKELKEERRAQGMCVYCGRPAVIKRDGAAGTGGGKLNDFTQTLSASPH